ncbi:Retrovirus-related Pol polyprotein from transposon RE1, partial [Linum grandiflorum]
RWQAIHSLYHDIKSQLITTITKPPFLLSALVNPKFFSSFFFSPMAAATPLTMALADSTTPSLPLQLPPITIKLDRTNFSLWRSTVVSTLEIFEFESHILKSDPPSATRIVATTDGAATTEPNPAFVSWKRRDRLVLLWLRSTMAERCLSLVVRAAMAHDAWKTIDSSFRSQTRARRMHLKIQLQALPKASLSMMDYIEKKRALDDSLADDLNPVTDEDLIGYILSGLDSTYGAFATAFMMKTDTLSVDDLIGLLLHEEARQEHDRTRHAALLPTPSVPPVALVGDRTSSSPASSRSDQRSSTRFSNDTRPRGHPICQLCRETGHEAIDCRHRNNLDAFPSRYNPAHGRGRGRTPSRSNLRHAYVAQSGDTSTMVDPSWYFDSGATDHVTPDLAKLSLVDDYNGNDKLQVGNEFAGGASSSRGTH